MGMKCIILKTKQFVMKPKNINMRNTILIMILMGLLSIPHVQAQFVDKSTDPRFGEIPESTINRIKNSVESEILYYRTKLSPEFDLESRYSYNQFGQVINRPTSKSLLLADSIQNIDDYKMILEVKRWPVGDPYLHYYLVVKKGNRFAYEGDTVSFDIFDRYFPFDEKYLVHYKPDTEPPYFGQVNLVSGNVFKTRIDREWSQGPSYIAALKFVYKRMAQYNSSRVGGFPTDNYETDEYIQLRVEKSDLAPSALLVRVPKDYPYRKFEVMYYTNDTLTTKGDIARLYEVKYTFRDQPKSVEEFKPTIREVGRAWLNSKINENREWSQFAYFIEGPPEIFEETVRIRGEIEKVYFHDTDPLILIVDKMGRTTVVGHEIQTRFMIKGKGKKEVVVTPSLEKVDSKIIYRNRGKQ